MLFSAIVVYILATLILADVFTNPSNSVTDLSITYYLGETVDVTWSTSLSQLTLMVSIWGGDAVGVLLSDAANGGAFTWTIGQNDNINAAQLKSDTNYVLVIADPSGNTSSRTGFVNGRLQSRGFRILTNAAISSTTSTASSTSDTSSTSPSASSTTRAAESSASSSSSATAAGSSGLSHGAKIGIGVGVSVGGLAIIAITATVVYFILRRRRDAGPGQVEVQGVSTVPDKKIYPEDGGAARYPPGPAQVPYGLGGAGRSGASVELE